MVRQYPYTLWVQSPSGTATRDSSGNYGTQAATFSQLSVCRDEANGSGRKVTLADSTEYVYDSLVQLPLACPDVAVNSLIQVRSGGSVRVQGIVKRFSRDQLHCRLWL